MSANSTPSKQRKSGEQWHKVVETVRTSLSNGNAHKLFEDDYFIFELIKLLYQDNVEANIKIEILTVIEQFGSGVLPTNSVDQAVSALLDVFRDILSGHYHSSVAVQLLITVTTIFIENEELLETSLCATFISQLVELINKVNHIPSRRLRSCSCQCLVQLETTRVGLLWKWREQFTKLVKEERTDACQDYMYLSLAVSSSRDQFDNSCETHATSEKTSDDERELLPVVSHIMDNVFLMSPAGLLNSAYHIVKIIKRCPEIPSTVFKPLVLQCLSSSDPCVISLMLFIQNEFPGQIVSEIEEKVLLKRAIEFVGNSRINTSTRLFIGQWIMGYLFQAHKFSSSMQLRGTMKPSLFDPIDIHTSKLDLIVKCCGQNARNDTVYSELHYLMQLAETTGGVRITCSLYHILYLHVIQNSSESVDNFVLSITRKLFQTFPHLIPVIVDFLQAVKESNSHGKLHIEILTLLHETVLSLSMKILLKNYHNYLQVWLLSAQDPSMLQQRPLRRLLDLVTEAAANVEDDWQLGCMVLSVCRAMMLHHHTDILYSYLGDLLMYMMNHYGDFDIRDQARCLYGLLTMVSDSKEKEIIGATVIDVMSLGENIADFFHGTVIHTAPAEIHTLNSSPIRWHRESLVVSYHKDPVNVYRSPSPNSTVALKDYFNQLSHIETTLKCTFHATLADESDYDNIVAVGFQAEETKELCFSEDVYLPFLDRTEPGVVEYSVIPKVPAQSAVNVRAVFGHQKSTYQCDLTPLQFGLVDFLAPFPWHLFDIKDKQAFFDSLWTNCTKTNAGTRSGVESIKILKCTQQSLAEIWANALILNGGPEEELKETNDYLFFLPPCFHLLFHARTHGTDVVLHIASDYWPVLGQLDNYLDNLIELI